MSPRARRTTAVALLGAFGTLTARGVLEATPPGGPARWMRANHRGDRVSLLEGPAVGVGLLLGGVLGAVDARAAGAVACATTGAAVFGVVDDLAEGTGSTAKGLGGHLGALARGQLTTGGLKVLGIGATSVLAAALATARPVAGRRVGWVVDVATSGALIAATANLVNLFDLRPGRALKAVALGAAPIVLHGRGGARVASAVVGVAAGAVRADLRERDMLGDGGANALGAALGLAAVQDAPRATRLALLAGVVAATLASERVSFTEVIGRTPVLREIDEWGRRQRGPQDISPAGAQG